MITNVGSNNVQYESVRRSCWWWRRWQVFGTSRVPLTLVGSRWVVDLKKNLKSLVVSCVIIVRQNRNGFLKSVSCTTACLLSPIGFSAVKRICDREMRARARVCNGPSRSLGARRAGGVDLDERRTYERYKKKTRPRKRARWHRMSLAPVANASTHAICRKRCTRYATFYRYIYKKKNFVVKSGVFFCPLLSLRVFARDLRRSGWRDSLNVCGTDC